MAIHIKKKNVGKFTAYKKRTGKTTAEALHSKNPHVRQMANFARNAKKWHHEEGGYITPIIPEEFGFGGILKAISPFASLIPGIGPLMAAGANIAGGLMEGDPQAELIAEQNRKKAVFAADAAQGNIGNKFTPTFSKGGLTRSKNYGSSKHPYAMVKSGDFAGGGRSYPIPTEADAKDALFLARIHHRGDVISKVKDRYPNLAELGGYLYAMGGGVPVELEKQEVYETPEGQMGQVNGPSHAEGGVDMNLPGGSFVWSDKLKSSSGRTFADEAARLGKMKAKYEKILNS